MGWRMAAGVTTGSTGPWTVKWRSHAPSPGAAAPGIYLVVATLECNPRVARAPEFLKEAGNLDFYIKPPCFVIMVTNLILSRNIL